MAQYRVIKMLRATFEAQKEKALMTFELLMENPAGIGDHSTEDFYMNAEEAARAVSACRYPPDGMRSFGPVRASQYGGADYPSKANGEIIVMAMIETKEGLANLEAICATPGLDAVYIGPSDLSYALDLEPRGDNPDPLHIETCNKILKTAHDNGIKAVMHCAGSEFAVGAAER